MKSIFSFGLAAGLAGLPPIAVAQPAATESPAAAQALRYDSAFADYKPWRDLPPAEWRKVNDAVREAAGQRGGHAGHASASAPSAAASRPASTAKPAHDGQGHHHGGPK